MKQEEKQRLVWVRLYEQTKDAGLTCRRCGISSSVLKKLTAFLARSFAPAMKGNKALLL
jgi:hypothetical protein